MAKRSKITAERRRRATVERYAERRAVLREQVRRASPGSAELAAAVRALPVAADSAPVRLRNR